jgi:hypothetical protein
MSGVTSPHAYQRGSVQSSARAQGSPAKYSCVAKRTAMAVQSRYAPNTFNARCEASRAGKVMPAVCD